MRYNQNHKKRGTHFSKECQTDPKAREDYDSMKENLRLKRENEELRKEIAFLKKAEVQEQIHSICHSHNGVDGYRSMTAYLKRTGHSCSAATIHKYMNTQMGLRSIVRPKSRCQSQASPIKYSGIS